LNREVLEVEKRITGRGFTLAEALITLAIIGIIAAITIPSIVANHQKKALETQFAKSYRTLSTAVQMAVAEHGDISTWDWKDSYTYEEMDELVKNYFVPYFNVIKFCSATDSNRDCFPDTMYKNLKGADYYNYGKDTRNCPQIALADGSSIRFYFGINDNMNKNKGMSMSLDFDINGYKKPNTIGRDLFSLQFYPTTNEFVPSGTNETFNEETQKYNKVSIDKILENCSKNGAGWYCAARIIQDGFKMNY